MSKAIIIVDMPEKCGECDFKQLHPDGNKTYCCGLCFQLTRDIRCVDNYDFPQSKRPKWCPLKPMPERKNENTTFYDSDYHTAVGYNACIEDILGN